jgi:small nuclear ribonucleoprotein G
MEKRLFVQLNGNRKVIGILRGYDVRGELLTLSRSKKILLLKRLKHIADRRTKQVFLNIVLDEAVEEKTGGERVRLGMVVCF